MNLWKLFRKSREEDADRAASVQDAWRHLRRWRTLIYALPLLLLTFLHLLLFPPSRGTRSYALDVGSIADHEIVAPISFTAPRPERELEAARRDAQQRVEPVYRVLSGAEGRTEQRLRDIVRRLEQSAESDTLGRRARAQWLSDQLPGVSAGSWNYVLQQENFPRVRAALEQVVRRTMSAGIVDVTPRGTYSKIHVLVDDAGTEITREISSVALGYRLREALLQEFSGLLKDPAAAGAATEIAASILVPNLSYDDAETERRRSVAMSEVPLSREYARNERILDAGVRVSRDDRSVLDALDSAMAERELAQDATIGIRLRSGRMLLVLGLFVGLGLMLQSEDRRRLRAIHRYLLLALLVGLHLALSALVLRNPQWGGEMAVPMVLIAMLATILFGSRAGIRIAFLGVLLLSIVPGIGGSSMLLWAVAAAAASRMVRRVRHRNQFYRAMGAVALTLTLAVGGIALAEGYGMDQFLSQWGRAVISAIACTAIVLFLLPLFEALFGVTTELTLLELSDLNHPLLRRMTLESPGTYHHSQVVGTLAEAAARAIDANSLAARVGANFHDIGKMLKPRYYAENQYGDNAHDDLSPSMSALVIAAHVKDGIELGRQWGLPREVIDYIPEHHGTSVMQYFYRKALERDDGKTVKVDDFRYPGPKPQSKETAIVMLADGVEASTRSLRRMTPSRIREMVRKIIDKRLAEGELDECGLSLSDLAKIREAFVPTLVGIHHERVAYPGQREHEDRKEQESLEARSRHRRGGSAVATGG